jgi:hypothetical protein
VFGIGNDGLVSRQEALAEGLSADDVRRLVRLGLWVPVRRGWYTTAAHWESLDAMRGRPLLRIRADHRALSRTHVISHASSALVLDLPILRPRDQVTHVTKYGAPRARVRNGIKHHQSRYRLEDVEFVDGLPVLGLARTALDIARESGFVAGVCAIDAARQRGVTLTELWAARVPMWHWPDVTVADQAVLFSDAGAESLGESLTRILLAEIGLHPIETQFELRDATGWARCDLRVGRHVIEFDGLVKLRSVSEGGVADRTPAEVVAEEKRRQDWVCGFGLGMSRVTWPELWGRQRELTGQRLLREYAATTARFGTNIDDLAPYVVLRRAG